MQIRIAAVTLLALLFVIRAVGQDPAARKAFAETTRQQIISNMGKNLPSGFNFSTQGPDATFFVYHRSNMTSSDCSLLLKGFDVKLRILGFTGVLCTDDRTGGTFVYDLIGQSFVFPAAARKDFAEKMRQAAVKEMGSSVIPGFNISAEGPDATFYIYHAPGITSSFCSGLLTESRVSTLRGLGFTRLTPRMMEMQPLLLI